MNEEENNQVILLQDENGEEHEFYIIDLVNQGDQKYVILQPADSENETKDEVEEEYEAVIMRVDEQDEEEDVLVLVEDDEEWEKVAKAFEEQQNS